MISQINLLHTTQVCISFLGPPSDYEISSDLLMLYSLRFLVIKEKENKASDGITLRRMLRSHLFFIITN